MVRKHTIMLAIAVSALLFSCTYPFDNRRTRRGTTTRAGPFLMILPSSNWHYLRTVRK